MNAHSLKGRGDSTSAIRNIFAFFLLSATLLLSAIPAYSQQCGNGCTDTGACNYDPLAATDDGSCIFFDCVITANNDAVTIEEGEIISLNVLANDDIPMGLFPSIQVLSDNPCFFIDYDGTVLQAVPGGDCCGEHTISYMLCGEDGLFCDPADVCITVNCGKPDCTHVNLEDFMGLDGAGDDPTDNSCISACENAETTVFVGYNPNNTYLWSVIGGTTSAGSNDAEIVITWGPSGSGNIQLVIGTPNGSETHNFCVDILPGPTASFTSDNYVCLGQQLCFSNTSVNADTYNWDFGDGNYSTMENPCHTYNTPGTHTVSLLATKFNYDEQGNPLCCCTDEFTIEIEVDPLPGPSIFWISTLCEGDSSKYWTDATNCDTYEWTVADENGIEFLFEGQGNDTICVNWPAGSFGTITLNVADCDSSYCSNPTTVVVPIIPTVSEISGPVVVCENSTEIYTLPKWMSTEYLWEVSGGTVIAGDSSHQATIMWGPAGTGTIHVDYYSAFLAGLPGHEEPECFGSADLNVDILPQFSVTNSGPSVVCVGNTSFISATNTPSNLYDWTITPAVGFSGDGTDLINVTWPATGTYVITATPSTSGTYCNSTESVVIQVVELEPATGIDGPTEICPGDTLYYTALTSSIGVNFSWTATNGTLSSSTGPTVSVAWDMTGPYTLTLTQQMQAMPNCISPPISINVTPKELVDPLVIIPGDSCTNILTNFSVGPAQHADAQFLWTISPTTGGSIAGGQGTANVQVQWNNDAIPVTISSQISLCGDTLTEDFDLTLHAPVVPVITQIGIMCPGVEATLDAGAGFTSYLWSTLATSQTTLTAGEGMYSVTTTDLNNCEATAYYEANDVPGPPAVITSGDPLEICLQNPHTVTLITPYYAGLTFEWFCNGVSQGPATADPTFVHPFANTPGTYTYVVQVIDTNTGCIETSLPVTVFEDICEGCTSEQYTLFPTATPQFPACNTVEFAFTSSNFTFGGWDFGDGFGSGLPNPTHTYTSAGCYDVTVFGTVPEVGTSDFCGVEEHRSVCVPIAADFDCVFLNCTDVQFTDLSTIMVGPGNNISSWFWDFGVGTSTSPSPLFSFPTTPGVYPVTLTVTNGNGCVSTATKNVTIDSVGLPSISGTPTPYCTGVPINFTSTAVNAVSYFWTFGDGASYSGQSPVHTYTTAGPFTVTVVATSSDGCTATNSISITVNPGIPEAVIEGELTICEGFTTTLSAPAGYMYLWSDLSTTQTIDVGAGTYSVVITDAFGCMRSLGPVTVVELPAPVVFISGNPVICDNNCTTLSVPYTPGYTYQWYESMTNPVPGGIGTQLIVCSGSILSPYVLEVTDQNGCRGVSAPFTVTQASSPSFTVSVSPDDCAGTPSTLTVSPVQPDVVYSWSNGMTGDVIVVSQAGTYTVIGTDTITGCSSSESAIIHPQPDLCLLPAGCYEVCNPDTICGPYGLTTYQWNMNGIAIPGETSPCLEVTESGSYNLTASNSFGCFTTSDSLYLEVIDCDDPCSDIAIDYSFLTNSQNNVDSCCFSLSYVNDFGGLQGLTIHTGDADLIADLGTVDPALQVSSNVGGSVSVIANPGTDPIPTGSVSDFIEICISNVTNDPQEIIIDWYDFASEVVCSDTLEFNCPEEPDCLYLQSDSIYCENGETIYNFTICNPHDNTFDIGFFTFSPTSPVGVILTPSEFDLTSDPIIPGTCRTLSVNLSGPGIAGELFCYQLVGHDFDPDLVPDALCCALDTTYCIEIPFCDPCDFVSVESVHASDDGCCYDVVLDNQYDGNFFDEIAVCVISPMTTITVNNPIGSGWTTSGLTDTSVSYLPGATFGNAVPFGGFSIPEICVQTNTAPNQQIEIKWMREGEVVCSDTIEVFCEPPCGYLLQESIECDPDGVWNFSALLKNTSALTMAEAHIFFNDPSLSAYDQIIPLGSLAPGAIFSSIDLAIGAPALAGDTICFTVTLHEVNSNGVFLTCCNFEHCIVLPDCGFTPDCLCDDAFFAAVSLGIDCTVSQNDPNSIDFNLVSFGQFSDCDRTRWSFGDGTGIVEGFGYETESHVFPGPGTYQVCVIVYRTDDNGDQCKRKVCKTVIVPISFSENELRIFPNPSNGLFQMQINRQIEGKANLTILDETQRPVFASELRGNFEEAKVDVDLTGVSRGVYLVQLQFEDKTIVQRIIVY